MIGILETATCNLSAYENIFTGYAMEYCVIKNPSDFDNVNTLFIPGVGSYDAAVAYLKDQGIFELAKNWVNTDNPTLAVCLGFQMLFQGSAEGDEDGFGVFEKRCIKFQDLKIPRISWAYVDWVDKREIMQNERYYFAHSYYVPVFEDTSAIANYTIDYSAAVKKGKVEGYQFHPEKSLCFGESIIKNFLDRYEKI